MYCLKIKNSGLWAKKAPVNNVQINTMRSLLLKKIFSPGLLPLLLLLAGLQVTAQKDSGSVFSSFDGTKIYYEVKGNGTPVILVHGFIVNGQSWKRTALYSDLLEKGYKVIIPDLRGNGQSDKPHNPEAYEQDAEAKDIMALASRLHLKKYEVVGYSRGSIIVSRLLVLDKRVTKAVMGGMGADFTNPEWPRRILFYHALMGDTVKELESMVKYVQQQQLDQLALAYLQKAQPSTSKAELARIKKPVLLICGDQDTDNGSAKELMTLIPGAKYQEVPGVHNTANGTAAFSRAVIDFLQKK
jgi:pimeloyl-ACP methyl ester carboxylesterase